MRLVGKVMTTLMLATALLQAPAIVVWVPPIVAFSPLSSVEQLDWRDFILRANQFYNPGGPAKRTRNRQEGREVRAYAMPYDPYPWCAFIFGPR